MIAFVIYVNGKRICAGGMDNREHVDWSMPQLKVGDEVTIKITDCDDTDPPSRRRTVEEVDAWARSLRQKDQTENDKDDLHPLPAPWE